ncbi:olfactory receptor 2G3-like [Pelodiscus sinensis]|uniref:olfactory receptor 2G3-like n=1 Tax=Pelodiscus sinensis TaxID=13735 RepID=UPI003F6C7641
MDDANWTSVSEFVANSMLVGLVWTDPQLHSPMYFFISQLSMVDMGMVSIILPQALVHALTQHRTMPFASCMAQLFIYVAVFNMEGYLLAAMAYDRYVAVCNPLRYAAVVTRSLCLKMVAASLAVVIPHALLHTVMAAQLRYCSNHLQHFLCHMQSLMSLSCTRSISKELVVSIEGVLVVGAPPTFILVSYIFIGVAVARLRSAQAVRKALSTCSSHLTVATLTYGTVIWVYFHPDSGNTPGQKQQVTFLYTSVVPTLNPLIYSLRNKDVAAALRRAKRKVLTWGT